MDFLAVTRLNVQVLTSFENRGLEDARTHYISASASAWLHVIPASSATAEGCVVPFVFDNGTGWIGFFCIKEGFRGNGYGRSLFQTCLDHFVSRAVRFVGLDAVTEQKPTYERRGFVSKGTIRLMTRRSVHELPTGKGSVVTGASSGGLGRSVIEIDKVSGEDLLQSELACTGLKRSRLWTHGALSDRSDVFGYAMTSQQEQHALQGWIVVRSCPDGHRFGPLYAESAEVASQLLEMALDRCTGSGEMIAEVWMGNTESLEVFTKLGWTPLGIDYHRMWLGGRVPAEQLPGGKAERSMFAIFDAGQG